MPYLKHLVCSSCGSKRTQGDCVTLAVDADGKTFIPPTQCCDKPLWVQDTNYYSGMRIFFKMREYLRENAIELQRDWPRRLYWDGTYYYEYNRFNRDYDKYLPDDVNLPPVLYSDSEELDRLNLELMHKKMGV